MFYRTISMIAWGWGNIAMYVFLSKDEFLAAFLSMVVAMGISIVFDTLHDSRLIANSR